MSRNRPEILGETSLNPGRNQQATPAAARSTRIEKWQFCRKSKPRKCIGLDKAWSMPRLRSEKLQFYHFGATNSLLENNPLEHVP
ncbi:MAG: hypothetical protein DWI22_04785 [Planctomycetota bacterium]|nr:MAG: hypothetical protein DWI22_04785 [Planctomycetota bacterium]